MLDVLAITLPIFIVIAVGFFAARFGGMSSGDVRAIGAFVLRFALPALIFKALSQTPFAQIVNVPYLVIYTSCSLAVFAAMFFLARTLRPGETSAQAIQALGSSCSNSGFVGYPIAALVVGSSASLGLALNMATENVVIIPLALALAEVGRHQGGSALALAARLLGRLVLNPLIIAIALGLVASLIGVKLPSPLERAINMLAAASGAAALFAVGGGLVGLKVAGVLSDVARVVSGKLILLPLAVLAAQHAAPSLDPNLSKAMLIFASAPMLSIYPLLARQYDHEDVGAAALLVATALSFFTISALLAAL